MEQLLALPSLTLAPRGFLHSQHLLFRSSPFAPHQIASYRPLPPPRRFHFWLLFFFHRFRHFCLASNKGLARRSTSTQGHRCSQQQLELLLDPDSPHSRRILPQFSLAPQHSPKTFPLSIFFHDSYSITRLAKYFKNTPMSSNALPKYVVKTLRF